MNKKVNFFLMTLFGVQLADGCFGEMQPDLVKYLVDVIVKDLNE